MGRAFDRRFLLAAALALPAVSPRARADAGVRVFAAASLEEALRAVAAGQAPPWRLSFGSSAVMARQIEQGAPADLFISADEAWMDHLAQRGLIQAGTRRLIAANRLALIAPRASNVRLRLARGADLAAALGPSGRLALADPAAVPAGRYARQALGALGLWDAAAGRLAPAESVRGALAFVARGEAPLGLVYATDAQAEPRVRVVDMAPAAAHDPIVYPAALTRRARAGAPARALAALTAPRAQAAFARLGFLPPPGAP